MKAWKERHALLTCVNAKYENRVRRNWDVIVNSDVIPPQPIRTCRSLTAPCRWSTGCLRPHTAGNRRLTPYRSWNSKDSAHRLPRLTAKKRGSKAWSASSRLAISGVGKATVIQARAASYRINALLRKEGTLIGGQVRLRHGRQEGMRRGQSHNRDQVQGEEGQ
jgi:hypothetical protein